MKGIKSLLVVLLFLTAFFQNTLASIYKSSDLSSDLASINIQAYSLDDRIIEVIRAYYQIENGKGARVEEVKSDTAISITYYHIPTKDDDSEGYIINIQIPLVKNSNSSDWNPILEGDLNKDNQSDLVVTVVTEFGNTTSSDIFVFISQGGKHRLNCVTSNQAISGCTGSFEASRISNNQIIGTSYCYAGDDARCCPSLLYETKVVFGVNGLQFLSKTKK